MIGIWSESESSSLHGWRCNTCSVVPDVAKARSSVLMLLPDLHVTIPCGKISSILPCAVVSIKSSASVCCVGSSVLPHRG
jgi:hypothetical protein